MNCFSCVYSSYSFDAKGCWAPYSNYTRTQADNVITTLDGCIANGQMVSGNSEEIQIEDLRQTPLQIVRQCNSTDEELLLTLVNSRMDVNQVNVSVSSSASATDLFPGYVGVSCSSSKGCGVSSMDGTGIKNYETSLNEKISVWMLCKNGPESSVTLTIDAAYLRDFVIEEEDHPILNKGGIAGIVVACCVAFIFVIGVIISTRGLVWFKNLFRCCSKNQTHNLPDDSPREKDVQRQETGIAGSDPIGHQPSNQVAIQPSISKDNGHNRNPLSAFIDNEMSGSASASVNGGELNATGQHLLSNHKDGPSSGYSTADPLKGAHRLLPEINTDKAPVAQAWKEAEQEESDRASNDELNKND